MPIFTLTLNPAYDVHCRADSFAPYRETSVTLLSRDAGGKGVNISRALTKNGVENKAVVVLGAENADEFCASMEKDGICTLALFVPGRIRENITLHTEGAPETRISFEGFSADATLLSRIESVVGTELSGAIVTFTGRVPEGVEIAKVKAFLQRLRERGARIVIDSKSMMLADLLECRPWLIKPNEEEIGAYSGVKISTLSDAADAARELFEKGIENVMISLGGMGAVLASAEGIFAAEVPRISVRSTVGAGDSAIAGFLAAAERGDTGAEALRLAVAYGTAACMTEGTQAPDPEVIREIYTSCCVKML